MTTQLLERPTSLDKRAKSQSPIAITWRVAATEACNAASQLVSDARAFDDERDDTSGMAKRLMAYAVVELAEISSKTEKDKVEAAFLNAEALINGALDLKDDKVGSKTEANLRHALTIVDQLTDVLHGALGIEAVRKAISTKPPTVVQSRQVSFNDHSARQVDLVLGSIATHANTLHHMVRNVGSGEEAMALEVVAMGLQIIGASADALADKPAVGGPCEWLVGDSFYDFENAVQA